MNEGTERICHAISHSFAAGGGVSGSSGAAQRPSLQHPFQLDRSHVKDGFDAIRRR